jgi:hypothetical protein
MSIDIRSPEEINAAEIQELQVKIDDLSKKVDLLFEVHATEIKAYQTFKGYQSSKRYQSFEEYQTFKGKS